MCKAVNLFYFKWSCSYLQDPVCDLLYFVFDSPRLIDMGKVYQQTNHENLEQAFNVAERDLGVTRLLDPEGMMGRCLKTEPQALGV